MKVADMLASFPTSNGSGEISTLRILTGLSGGVQSNISAQINGRKNSEAIIINFISIVY